MGSLLAGLVRHRRRSTLSAPFFFIHIMRTAGTSFRKMLEQAHSSPEIYPGDARIERLGRYPELVDVLRDRDVVTTASLVAGHYPYVLRSLWTEPPFTGTFLRDPVERTVSLLRFARLRRPQFNATTPLSEVFDDNDLRVAMVRNYQTKVFSIPSLDERQGVNTPLSDESISLELAKERLGACDFVGVTERFEESVAAFQGLTRISFNDMIYANQSQSRDEVDEQLHARIVEETALDSELVQHAHLLLDQRLSRARGRMSS